MQRLLLGCYAVLPSLPSSRKQLVPWNRRHRASEGEGGSPPPSFRSYRDPPAVPVHLCTAVATERVKTFWTLLVVISLIGRMWKIDSSIAPTEPRDTQYLLLREAVGSQRRCHGIAAWEGLEEGARGTVSIISKDVFTKSMEKEIMTAYFSLNERIAHSFKTGAWTKRKGRFVCFFFFPFFFFFFVFLFLLAWDYSVDKSIYLCVSMYRSVPVWTGCLLKHFCIASHSRTADR